MRFSEARVERVQKILKTYYGLVASEKQIRQLDRSLK